MKIPKSYKGFITRNKCDGCWDCAEIFTTPRCNNNCDFCIAKDLMKSFPADTDFDVEKVSEAINKTNHKYIMFSGGEPLLYIKKVIQVIKNIKGREIYIYTSLPKVNPDDLNELLENIAGMNISVLSENYKRVEWFRNTPVGYDRNSLLASLPHKEKIQLSMILLPGFIKEDVFKCVNYFYKMGFRTFHITEADWARHYRSFERIFGVKLKSPYSHGCSSDISYMFENYPDITVRVRRRCFLIEQSCEASFLDLLKILIKRFILRNRKKFYQTYIRFDGKICHSYEELKETK